jgi:hypothetical protein
MIARIEAMGGSYTPHLEQDHTHFLIAWKGEGDKWQAATEWGTPVVSREWLRACEMRRGKHTPTHTHPHPHTPTFTPTHVK